MSQKVEKMLKQLGIKGHIIATTLRIMSEMKDIGSHRCTKLKIFYCCYCAHLDCGDDITAKELGRKFSLRDAEIRKCPDNFSPSRTGYWPPKKNSSVRHHINTYGIQLQLSDDAIEDMISIADQALAVDRSLSQNVPPTLAAGIVMYYLETSGIKLEDKKAMEAITERCMTTIDTITKLVSVALNS